MNLPRVCWCPTLVAGLLVPALSGCDNRDDSIPQAATSALLEDARKCAPAITALATSSVVDDELDARSPPTSTDAPPYAPAAVSPHAGVYLGSTTAPPRAPATESHDDRSDDASHSSAALDSDSDAEAVLLLAVDTAGRIQGYVRGAPGVAAGDWLMLRDTIAPHQTCAPVLLRDRAGRRYGAITLDFKRGGRHREVIAKLQRKGHAALDFAALPLDAAAALGTGDRFVAHHLDLEHDAHDAPRGTAPLELQVGAADAHGTRALRARTDGVTLDAALMPSGVEGLYMATLQVAAAADGSRAAAPHRVDGLGIVERLSDGRLALTLIGADAHARVAVEATAR